MLTPDLVRTRRRSGELHIVALSESERERGRLYADELLVATKAIVGLSREEFDTAIDALDSTGMDRRFRDGLVKLALDRCDIEASVGEKAPQLRAAIFALSARERLSGTFNREAILGAVAKEFELSPEAVEHGMYGDLRSAHVIRGFEAIGAAALVAQYEQSGTEAVLLRATRVAVHLRTPSAGAARIFFRRIKFLRLLFTIERGDPSSRGYTVTLDGPMSMFEASTSYGLKLALVTRSLEGCGPFSIVADVFWGPKREPLVFRARGEAPNHDGGADAADAPAVSEEVAELLAAWDRLSSGWTAKPTSKVLHLPGIGMSIPDVVFSRDDVDIYFEVLGYWSRAAVWRRVELVEAGLPARVLFAVSQKLRVSEEVLSDETPSSLYVFRRTMSPRAIAEKLEVIASRQHIPYPTGVAAEDVLAEPTAAPKRTRRRKKQTEGGETTT